MGGMIAYLIYTVHTKHLLNTAQRKRQMVEPLPIADNKDELD